MNLILSEISDLRWRDTCVEELVATGCEKQQTWLCSVPWERLISSSELQRGNDDHENDEGIFKL